MTDLEHLELTRQRLYQLQLAWMRSEEAPLDVRAWLVNDLSHKYGIWYDWEVRGFLLDMSLVNVKLDTKPQQEIANNFDFLLSEITLRINQTIAEQK
jgi:hypothetical protein